MPQLYTRVFLQILDSSIAEDFTLRHVFEDFLKLCDYETGVVDITRQALARRLNIPMETLDGAIAKLEAPDPASRDPDFFGCRLERLDKHRDWGWRIVNWPKYKEINTRADVADRVARHRAKEAEGKFKKPTLNEVKLLFTKSGLPMNEAERFFNFYESNGWRVGRNPMKSFPHAAANWKKAFDEKRYADRTTNSTQGSNRDKGTLNDGRSAQYAGVGRVPAVPTAPRPTA